MFRKHFLKVLTVAFVQAPATFAGAAELTLGPMIGHTTATTARIWIRADGPCRLAVRAVPSAGGKAISSEAIRLVESNNFCGGVTLTPRGLGIITIETQASPATSRLEFFDEHGKPRLGRRIPYTTPGALRALWDSPSGVNKEVARSSDGELRPATSGPLWEALPATTGETLTEENLKWAARKP